MAPNSIVRGGIQYVMGKSILGPPVEEVLQRGYGLAIFQPGDVVPDDAEASIPILKSLTPTGKTQRPGAIGAWGWMYSKVADVLELDSRIDKHGLIAWGHSRYGKAALIAGAYDDRFALIISHQSGTGGASLHRDGVGQSVEHINRTYPHWFTPAFDRYSNNEQALTFDQHYLIALCAPTPVLLGNAERDKWSDPAGAFIAAREASSVWQLYDKPGMIQSKMSEISVDGSVNFQLRKGRHGVTSGDWEWFLNAADRVF